jgi:DNA primase
MSNLIINHHLIDSSLDSILYKLREETKGLKLKDIVNKGENYFVSCPFHKGGQEQHASCNVYCGDGDLPFGTFNCYSCGESGTLVKFVAQVLEIDENSAEQWLIDNFGGTILDTPIEFNSSISFENKEQNIETIDEKELDNFKNYHPYMTKRKLTPQVIETFKIKYNPKTDTIIMPVWDDKNNLVMLTQRAVIGKTFTNDKNSNKPIYLLNKVINKDYKYVIICESQIDALTCWGWGVPAIAFMGTGSDKQYETLNKYTFNCIVTMFDNDEAGRKFTKIFNRRVRQDQFIQNINWYNINKKDINELTEEEFSYLLLKNGINWRLPLKEN